MANSFKIMNLVFFILVAHVAGFAQSELTDSNAELRAMEIISQAQNKIINGKAHSTFDSVGVRLAGVRTMITKKPIDLNRQMETESGSEIAILVDHKRAGTTKVYVAEIENEKIITKKFDTLDKNGKIVANWQHNYNGELIDYDLTFQKFGIPSDYKATVSVENFRNRISNYVYPFCLCNWIEDSVKLKYMGKAEVGDKYADVVGMNWVNETYTTILFFDEINHQLLLKSSVTKGGNTISNLEEYYSDYNIISGFFVPTKLTRILKTTSKEDLGENYVEIREELELKELKINEPFEPKEFTK